MNMIKEKLLRIQDLYNTYQVQEDLLKHNLTAGKRASIRREQVFLKEKVIHSLKSIRAEMIPTLYRVVLLDPEVDNKYITVIMRADSVKDIELYLQLSNSMDGTQYKISSVRRLENVSEGQAYLKEL